jgi:hypothetical protein
MTICATRSPRREVQGEAIEVAGGDFDFAAAVGVLSKL